MHDENRKEALYWRDVGTLEAYYDANMDVASVSPVFNLYDKSWPLHTWQQQYPPAKFVFADPERMGVALDSVVAGGSIVSGGHVEHSVLGTETYIDPDARITESITLPPLRADGTGRAYVPRPIPRWSRPAGHQNRSRPAGSISARSPASQ